MSAKFEIKQTKNKMNKIGKFVHTCVRGRQTQMRLFDELWKIRDHALLVYQCHRVHNTDGWICTWGRRREEEDASLFSTRLTTYCNSPPFLYSLKRRHISFYLFFLFWRKRKFKKKRRKKRFWLILYFFNSSNTFE